MYQEASSMLKIYSKAAITPYTPGLQPDLLEEQIQDLLGKAQSLRQYMSRYRLLTKMYPVQPPEDWTERQKYGLAMLVLKSRSDLKMLTQPSANVSLLPAPRKCIPIML